MFLYRSLSLSISSTSNTSTSFFRIIRSSSENAKIIVDLKSSPPITRKSDRCFHRLPSRIRAEQTDVLYPVLFGDRSDQSFNILDRKYFFIIFLSLLMRELTETERILYHDSTYVSVYFNIPNSGQFLFTILQKFQAFACYFHLYPALLLFFRSAPSLISE